MIYHDYSGWNFSISWNTGRVTRQPEEQRQNEKLKRISRSRVANVFFSLCALYVALFNQNHREGKLIKITEMAVRCKFRIDSLLFFLLLLLSIFSLFRVSLNTSIKWTRNSEIVLCYLVKGSRSSVSHDNKRKRCHLSSPSFPNPPSTIRRSLRIPFSRAIRVERFGMNRATSFVRVPLRVLRRRRTVYNDRPEHNDRGKGEASIPRRWHLIPRN